jgi:hypothetical protein
MIYLFVLDFLQTPNQTEFNIIISDNNVMLTAKKKKEEMIEVFSNHNKHVK